MSNIKYHKATNKVTQVLGVIDSFSLEGDFKNVLESLQTQYNNYSKYLSTPQEVSEYKDYMKKIGAYLDGSTKKLVKFDRIYLDWHRTYDEDSELRVIGERNFDEFELKVLEAENTVIQQKQAEQEKETLKVLLKKYPDVAGKAGL